MSLHMPESSFSSMKFRGDTSAQNDHSLFSPIRVLHEHQNKSDTPYLTPTSSRPGTKNVRFKGTGVGGVTYSSPNVLSGHGGPSVHQGSGQSHGPYPAHSNHHNAQGLGGMGHGRAQHYTSPAYSQSLPNLGLSVKDRLDYAAGFPTIAQKIEAISNICFNEISLKDFAINLQYLLKLIFSLDQIKTSGDTVSSKSSFCLNALYHRRFDNSTISQHVFNDAKNIVEFLSPNGALFSKFYELQKKKIVPRIDQELETILKRFYPEKFKVRGDLGPGHQDDHCGQNPLGGHQGHDGSHNLGLGHLGTKSVNETHNHGMSHGLADQMNDGGLGQSSSNAINPVVTTTNISSPNYVRSTENINQISAFELYFCCFAVYGLCHDRSYEGIVEYYCGQFNSNANNVHGHSFATSFMSRYYLVQSNNRNDKVYYILLQYYLNQYMPLNLDYPKLIIDKQAQAQHHSPKSPSKPSLTQKFSAIFKPNAFSKQNFEDYSKQNSSNLIGSGTCASSTSRTSNAIVVENVNYCLLLADGLISSLCSVWFNEEFWPANSGFMLYEEHVRNLRVIIKHVLTFVTIDTNSILELSKSELYLPEIICQVKNFQNSVVQVHIQPKMFRMMQNIFEFYNLPPKIMSGAYFRSIVELWLSYIQPWRYTDSSNSSSFAAGKPNTVLNLSGGAWFGPYTTTGAGAGSEQKARLPENLQDSKIWLPYIAANLDCYTTLFIDILKRALRVDISSYQEALILNRTLRVFGQTNLMDLIGLAVDRPQTPSQASHNISAAINSSYFDRFPENRYLLFSESNLAVVKALMEALQQVLAHKFNFYINLKKDKIRHKVKEGGTSSPIIDAQAWLKYLKDFLTLESNLTTSTDFPSIRETKLLENKLTSSLDHLSKLFNVAIPSPPAASDEDDSNSQSKISPKKLKELGRRIENCNYNMPMAAGNYAEFDLDGDFSSVKLTEFGKSELFESGGQKHAPIVINKHYDDLECMATEINIVLILAKILGGLLTKYFGRYLKGVEVGEPGFKFDFGRYWFMTAPNGMRYSSARISVRFLAHMGFLLYLSCFYLLFSLIGYNKIQFLCLVTACLGIFAVGRYFLNNPLKGLKIE